MSEMAAFSLSAEPSDPDYRSQYNGEHDMTSPTPPRIPLFVPSQHWSPHVQSLAGYKGYSAQHYSSGFDMTPSSSPYHSYEHWQHEYNTFPSNTATLDPATQRLNPDNFLEAAGDAKR